MHVIPRKKGQRVVIGDIILTVVEVRGDEVRFGIELVRPYAGRRRLSCGTIARRIP